MSHPLAQVAFKVSLIIAVTGVAGAVVVALVGLVLGLVLPAKSQAAAPSAEVPAQMCGADDVMPVGGSGHLAQNNVWGADTQQCVTVVGEALRVDVADHDRPITGSPASTPTLLEGCHWGRCSIGSELPVQVGKLPKLSSDLSTVQVNSGAYNAGYVLWFHSQPATNSAPDGAEIVVWLSSRGDVRPAGSVVAGAVELSGAPWRVWHDRQSGHDRITYERLGSVTSVSGLDVRSFAQDSAQRGFVRPEWYLIGIEAGFNLWRGGAGNAVEAFSVSVDGPPANALPPGGVTIAPPAPAGKAGCFASMSVDDSWEGGFTATVTVSNIGDAPVRGWSVEWAFPSGQRVENSWNAQVSQDGPKVRAANQGYNAAIEPAGSITFGMQGTGSPPGIVELTCDAV